MPSIDEEERLINPVSYNSNLDKNDLAHIIVNVNMRAVNNFSQKLRRNVSTLERPLVNARGSGKSYIYRQL